MSKSEHIIPKEQQKHKEFSTFRFERHNNNKFAWSSTASRREQDQLSLAGLVVMAKDPKDLTGHNGDEAKKRSNLITPFVARHRNRDAALEAMHTAIVIDHDDGKHFEPEIMAKYGIELGGESGIAYLAYSTANSEADAQRWKVVIPLARPVDADKAEMLSAGITYYLKTDAAQARTAQGFYAPCKTKTNKDHYTCIDQTTKPRLNPDDHDHPFIKKAMDWYQKREEERLKVAKAATPKPRPEGSVKGDAGIVDLINAHYSLADLLSAYGYIQRGDKWLSPESESCMAGVVIFEGKDGRERLYSHHGLTDELSAQHIHHGGHSLDAADVLCALKYGNNFSKMIGDEADLLDRDGQKRRQVEYAIKDKDKKLKEEARHSEPLDLSEFSDSVVETERPRLTGILGEMQKFIHHHLPYPDWDVAAFIALSLFEVFAGKRYRVEADLGTANICEINILLAPTGFGKETAKRCLVYFAEAVKKEIGKRIKQTGKNIDLPVWCGAYVETGGLPASAQALHEVLYSSHEQGHSLFIIADEFGDSLKEIKNGSKTDQAALSHLKKIYSTQVGTVGIKGASSQKDNEERQPVNNPCLSLLGLATPGSFYDGLQGAGAEDGLYGRMIIFDSGNKYPPKKRGKRNTKVSGDLVNQLTELTGWGFGNQEVVTIRATPKACELLYKYDDEIFDRKKKSGGSVGNLSARLELQVFKLAAKMAISDRTNIVQPQHIEAAKTLRMFWYNRLIDGCGVNGVSLSGEHQTVAAADQIEKVIIKKNKGLYESRFALYSKAYAKLDLINQERVRDELIRRGKCEPRGKRWIVKK